MSRLLLTLAATAGIALSAAVPAGAQDKIRIGSPYQTTTLDPMRSAAAGNIETYGQIYSRLLRRDENGELQPGLAESWAVKEDGRVITLNLRDARFSNGEPITAEDVVFSLERVRDNEESAYPAPLQTMEDIVAQDEDTVAITLKHPFAPFLGNLEVFNAAIVDKSDVEARGEEAFTKNTVTSGPYMVEEWIPNDRIVLAPNPHYWREGYPKNAGAELIEIGAENTRVSMMQSGELDAAREIPWSQVEQLKATEGIEMPLEPSTQIFVVLLNHARAPFHDVKVRKAAAMALDVEGITRAMTFGNATPANSTLPMALDYWDEDAPGIPYDAEGARKMLEESGYDGQPVTILITDNPEREKMAVLMQAQWDQVGLKSTIEKVDGGTWWSRVPEGDYDAAPTWYYNETTDPDLALRWALCGSCGSDSFHTKFNNEDVNRLTEEAAAELEPAKRAELYKKVQEITLDQVSQIPLYYPPFANAYSDRVKGLGMSPALQWTLEDAEIAE